MQNKSKLKELAVKKIKVLFNEAKFNKDKANRYVKLARDIAMKVNLSMPKEFRRRYCKHCNSYFTSDNYIVTTRNKVVFF